MERSSFIRQIKIKFLFWVYDTEYFMKYDFPLLGYGLE